MYIHLAPAGLDHVLTEELGDDVRRLDDLFISEKPSRFAQVSWVDAQEFQFKSISEAVRHLRGLQRNWWLHPTAARGRSKLIQEQLPPLRVKPITFGTPAPTAPMGAWTLADETTMLYSAVTTNPYPDGIVNFVEDKEGPPSRAYLKLWEWFTLEGVAPRPGETCLDLGSSPGGWTWVLDQLGANVISVDKAPLSSDVKWSPRVDYRGESAFGLEPFAVDWLFSDIICYPSRLLELVKRWDGFAKHMVCTIKFQGATEFKTLDQFMALPGSRVRHLACNKHELTWSRNVD